MTVSALLSANSYLLYTHVFVACVDFQREQYIELSAKAVLAPMVS